MAIPKFVKVTTQESKLKLVINTLNGKLVITFSQFPLGMWKPHLRLVFLCHSSILLPLPTISPTYHHYGEHRHLRPHFKKLTSKPCMRVNISTSSSSPLLTTP